MGECRLSSWAASTSEPPHWTSSDADADIRGPVHAEQVNARGPYYRGPEAVGMVNRLGGHITTVAVPVHPQPPVVHIGPGRHLLHGG